MLEYVEAWADEQDCDAVALASPRSKESVHQFYEEQDDERWGDVLEKQCYSRTR